MSNFENRVSPKIIQDIAQDPRESSTIQCPDFGSEHNFGGKSGTRLSMTPEQRCEWSVYLIAPENISSSTCEGNRKHKQVAQALFEGRAMDAITAAQELYEYFHVNGDTCYGAYRMASVYELIGDIPKAIESYTEAAANAGNSMFFSNAAVRRLSKLQEE